MRKFGILGFGCLVLSLYVLIASAVKAQDAATLTGEGISGDIDKKRRGPTVSVRTVTEANSTKILVDAYVADKQYEKYPIQFDFFVNRKFITSQVRSIDLPGPIGIDVTKEQATTPFNYTIVAKVLHPNSVYTSVINAVAFNSTLGSTLDCTLTTGVNGENTIEYIANSVSLSQNGNNSVSIEFETSSTPDGHTVKVSGSTTIAETSATGTLTITEDSSTPKDVTLSGDVEKTGDKITSLSMETEDGDTALSCS